MQHGPQPLMQRLAQPLVLLLLLVFSSLVLAAESPIKSPNDQNDYRVIQLDNGLKAILVSSPGSDKAAASLNVAVGSGDDPRDREGLAHFLEHMLFLGTEKYPDPGEYQQFIRSHGGSHNAFTAFQDTNYFFDVEADYLGNALDRFAQQFSAPLFTPDLVDRERRAVHSEFSSKLKEDGRRLYSAKKAVTNPDHAFSQFAVGNLNTLDNTGERPLHDDLVRFWKTHYSANLMTLAVYGPQSLDRLEAMVRSRFNAIANRNLEAKEHRAPLFKPGTLPARLTVDALKDVRSLSLTFPIPSQRDNYRAKPANYVAHLLGHEGPGSLFDVLKQEGLVESLSAGSGMDTGNEATLELTMSLTPEGLERQDEILQLTFAYIGLIREQGINEQRFREMKQLAEIDFRFRERGQPVHEVMRLSSQLRHVPPRDVLRSHWMMEEYAPAAYRDILDRLTPDNVLISILQPEPDIETPNLTRWYQTAYQFQTVSADTLRTPAKSSLAAKLALPEPNPFIPENLDMVAGASMDRPTRLTSNTDLAIWYARDTRFSTPKANVYISLRSPATRESARSNVLSTLLVDAINSNLNAWAYPAQIAGLDYRVYTHLRGVTIRVGGYSDKLHTLMTRILLQMADPILSEKRFEIARQKLVDKLTNETRERPVQQASEFIQSTLIEGAWSTREKLAAAREVSLDDLKAYAREFRQQLDPVMLAHGNLTEASALNIANQIQAMMLADSDIVTVKRSGVRELPPGETRVTLEVDHPDTGYSLYAQGRDTGFEERAAYRLLGQIISSPFYEDIRTQRQLGYIVYATPFEMLETPALGFIVQSPEATASDIDTAVREFAAGFEQQLVDMSPEDLQREKRAVISKLMEQERQLGEISERYWREIDRNAQDFNSREQLARAIQAIDKERLIDTFRRCLLERQHALRVTTAKEAGDIDKIVQRLLERGVVSSS